MNAIPTVRVSGRSAYFIRLLVDFGHLTPQNESELLARSIERAMKRGLASVSLELVREVASELLFETQPRQAGGILAEDWPLLFT